MLLKYGVVRKSFAQNPLFASWAASESYGEKKVLRTCARSISPCFFAQQPDECHSQADGWHALRYAEGRA